MKSPLVSQSTAAGAPDWLLLIAVLPTDDPAVRMRVLRMLESLGAAVLREGAFLLPDSPASRQALEHLAEHLGKSTGSAHVLKASAMSPAQQDAYRALFDRSARYEKLIKVVDSLKIGFGVTDPGSIFRVLHKQRNELEMICALDFFPTEIRKRAEKSLNEAEAEVRKLLFPTQRRAELTPGDRLLGRTWATRKPLWADRLASAWLIRRFIDPEAALIWLDKSQSLPAQAVGFAFDGAHFGNTGTRVTFEELLPRFDLEKNTALSRIGTIVHYLEIEGTPVAEAAGVQTLLQGALRRCTSED
ncbi:MAG: chromate resistance protein, partial [Betaproteobacteria bacterium]|nr:chromate resistance protein [Betaproteobacteria bacterium]